MATRLFGGQVAAFATSMSIGVSNVAETVNDVVLGGEVANLPIDSRSASEFGYEAVYRTAFPAASAYAVYEVGLYNDTNERLTRSIDVASLEDVWANASVVTGPGRMRANVVRVNFSASGTTNAELLTLSEDLSAFVGTDLVTIFFTGHTNLSSFRVRIGKDASNYYQFEVTAPVAGYNIIRLPISSAVATGAPDWSTVTYLALRPSGSAAGAGTIDFDGIRFEQSVTNSGSILVAREVLASPVLLDQFIASNIEYAHGVVV